MCALIKSMRMLIVENFKTSAKWMRHAILQQDPQCAVDVVSSCAEALDVPDSYDVYIVDINLEDRGDGLKVIERMKNKGVVVAMSADNTFESRALECGASFFLDKFTNPIARLHLALKKIGEMSAG